MDSPSPSYRYQQVKEHGEFFHPGMSEQDFIKAHEYIERKVEEYVFEDKRPSSSVDLKYLSK